MQDKKIVVAIGILAVIVLVMVILSMALNARKNGLKQQSNSTTPTEQTSEIIPVISSTQLPAPGALAQVGEEIIYDESVNSSLQFYSETEKEGARRGVTELMVRESIILQEGAKAKMITLSPEIYNSPSLSRGKRTKAVEQIMGEVNQNSVDTLTAEVVTLWYKNSGIEGKPNLAQAKQTAYSKISNLQQQVKLQNMTMQEAADAINRDASLANLDSNYKNNSFFIIEGSNDESSTGITQLRDLVWSLSPNEVSDVTQVTEDNGTSEFYAFAQVTKKTSGQGKMLSFEDWFAQVSQKYAQIYY